MSLMSDESVSGFSSKVRIRVRVKFSIRVGVGYRVSVGFRVELQVFFSRVKYFDSRLMGLFEFQSQWKTVKLVLIKYLIMKCILFHYQFKIPWKMHV